MPVEPWGNKLKTRVVTLPSRIGGTGTNIASALRLALEMSWRCPRGARRRVFLLSDGVDNRATHDTEADPSSGGRGLWLHSDCGGIDAVCAFIQHLLRKFDPQGCVTFEWSHDCSKPRVDAFGGGAAIVTAQEIKTISTWGWLQEHAPASERTAA